jgi:hypothetical protein
MPLSDGQEHTMDIGASGIVLPRTVDDVDSAFMTEVLRRSGVIDETNEVVALTESDVGMTAGYFPQSRRSRATTSERSTRRVRSL